MNRNQQKYKYKQSLYLYFNNIKYYQKTTSNQKRKKYNQNE
jgi:hypothetical protein